MGRHSGGSGGQKSNWPPIIIVKEEIQKNREEKSKWPPIITAEEEIEKKIRTEIQLSINNYR